MASNDPNSGGTTPEVPPANPLTAAAQAKIALLRTMGDDFPDDPQAKPLTLAEIRLANSTPIIFLEKGALVTDASPVIAGAMTIDGEILRQAVAADLANGGVLDELNALTRRVETYMIRNKLKAVRIARDIYRLAQGYAKTDPGNPILTHVLEMKRVLRKAPKRVKKGGTAPAAPAETAANDEQSAANKK